jgi:hypothetical protein
MLRSLSYGWIFVLAAATSTARAAPAACLAGVYSGNAMELAAELDLATDGHFQYALAYGALDEQAEGRWENDNASVYLTSAAVTPARFSLTGESSGPNGAFRIALDVPQGMNRQYFDARVTLANGEVIDHQLADDGLTLRLEPGARVVLVQFELGVFALQSQRFALSSGNGRVARFRFEPNDLGKVAFAHTPLTIDGNDLLLDHLGRQLRFRPESGGCRH